jgi:hypothetical protein
MTLLVVGLKIPLKQAIPSFLLLTFGYASADIIVAAISGQYSRFSSNGVL